VRRGIGRKPLVVGFTATQCLLTVIFGIVVASGAPPVWLMAGLLFAASTFFNAMQPIAQAMLADIADPAHHGAAFGMSNLIGEIGAVLSPGGQRRAARRDGRLDRGDLPRRGADRLRGGPVRLRAQGAALRVMGFDRSVPARQPATAGPRAS
jgi:hypothetical protein